MMPQDCLRYAPQVDARLDGEDADPGLEAHLAACPSCRSEAASRAVLKRALSRVVLPPPPRAFDRALLAPVRRRWWPAKAAAALLAALFLLSVPRATPEVLAATRFHEDVLAGRVTLRNLGLRPTATRAEIPSGCPCPPDLGPASPFVVYGRDETAVSCLALDDPRPRAPAWRRLGRHTVLVRPHRGLLEIWVSRQSQEELAAWLAARDPDPRTWSLREFT